MDKSTQLLAGVLKMDPATLATKLETDEGKTEVETTLKSLQVFTTEEMASKMNNYRSSLTFDMLPDKLKDEAKELVFGDAQGKALEKKEKELAKLYDITEYEGITDLVKKIHESASEGDATLQETVTKLRKTVTDMETAHAEKIDEINAGFATRLGAIELTKSIDVYKDRFDIKEENPEALKIKQKNYTDLVKTMFDSKYKLAPGENGAQVVQDLQGQKVLDDKLHTPVELSTVLDELVANSGLPIKVSRKKSGRGDETDGDGNPNPESKTFYKSHDMSEFETFDHFLQSEAGKGLTVGDDESNKAFEAWNEAHSAQT